MRTKNIHYLPGRLRIKIPGLKNNINLTEKISLYLSKTNGINSYEINPFTGNVLLYFDELQYSLEEIIIFLKSIIENDEYPADNSPTNEIQTTENQTARIVHNTTYRDLNIEKLWAHVLLGGAVLSLLFFKRYIRGVSRLAGTRAVFGFSAITTVITGYPVIKNGLENLVKKGNINYELLLGTLGYASLLLRENVVGLTAVWAANVLGLINSNALANSRSEIKNIYLKEGINEEPRQFSKREITSDEEDPMLYKLVSISFIVGIITYFLTRSLGRTAAVLLASAPSSFKLATPIPLKNSINLLNSKNIRINDSGAVLDAGRTNTVLFDKTGTLTEGQKEIKEIIPLTGYTKTEIFKIVNDIKNMNNKESQFKMKYKNMSVMYGYAEYLYRRKVKVKHVQDQAQKMDNHGLSVKYLSLDGELVGLIGEGEFVRNETLSIIRNIKDLGIDNIVVMSSDSKENTRCFAKKLGIRQSFGGLSQKQKAELVKEYQDTGNIVCVIGDGVNDISAMKKADFSIGIYRKGSPEIVKEADFVVEESMFKLIPEIFSVGKKLMKLRLHNKLITSGISIWGSIASAAGRIPLYSSTLIPHISSLAVILNSSLLPFKKAGNISNNSMKEAAAAMEAPKLSEMNKRNEDIRKLHIVADYHNMLPERACQILKVKHLTGIESEDVQKRLKIYGSNTITEHKKITFAQLFIEQLKDFMLLFSLGAGGISLLLGEKIDAITISFIVLLEAVLGAYQEYKAEQNLDALKKLATPESIVLRDGEQQKIPSKDIVPGDIILLEAGDKIPVDARIINSYNFEVEESILTGESLPVNKTDNEIIDKNASLADRKNMVYMGTVVTKGKAKVVTVSTGMFTELGRIAEMLEQVEQDKPEIQSEMSNIGFKITRICTFACASIILMGILRGNTLFEMLRTGVSLAVGAVPEGLGAVVTLTMAFAVHRMVKKNCIVRKLTAMPNLGSVNVICTDKTGTLTENQMTVTKLFAGNKLWSVTGSGYKPFGEFLKDNKQVKKIEDEDLVKLLHTGMVCNNSRITNKNENIWEVQGDPTEGALLTVGAKGGVYQNCVNKISKRYKEIPFDSERKLMSVICIENDGDKVLYSKGAVEIVLKKCNRILINGEVREINQLDKKKIINENINMGKNALRILAMAYRPLLDNDECEENFIFIGLVGMIDPPRQGVKKAIATCYKAGIKVIMITGDNKDTASAIAKEIGLRKGKVIEGNSIEKMSQQELIDIIENISVVARTSPHQKLRIVQALKKKNYTVAMTGDGVNDAPAIKEANIGLAMGRSGTEVTKEASEIVLTDDDFSNIVSAVQEGRGVRNNIKTSILYVLTGNLGEIIAVFLSAVAGVAPPLIPTQILWVNLATESFPALALGSAPPGNNCMEEMPYEKKEPIISSKLAKKITVRGVISGLTTFGIYLTALRSGLNITKARTLAFANLIIGQMIHALDCSKYKGETKEKDWVKQAAALSTSLLLAVIYIPALRGIFGTVPLNIIDWSKVLLFAGFVGKVDSFLI